MLSPNRANKDSGRQWNHSKSISSKIYLIMGGQAGFGAWIGAETFVPLFLGRFFFMRLNSLFLILKQKLNKSKMKWIMYIQKKCEIVPYLISETPKVAKTLLKVEPKKFLSGFFAWRLYCILLISKIFSPQIILCNRIWKVNDFLL